MSSVRLRKDQSDRICKSGATAVAEYAVRRLFRGDFLPGLEWWDGTGMRIHGEKLQRLAKKTDDKTTLELVSLSSTNRVLKKFFSTIPAGLASEAMRLLLDVHFSTPDAVKEKQIEAAKAILAAEWELLRSQTLQGPDGQKFLVGE